jgi:hypothetical protein
MFTQKARIDLEEAMQMNTELSTSVQPRYVRLAARAATQPAKTPAKASAGAASKASAKKTPMVSFRCAAVEKFAYVCGDVVRCRAGPPRSRHGVLRPHAGAPSCARARTLCSLLTAPHAVVLRCCLGHSTAGGPLHPRARRDEL